jgi:Pyruvate/2-oxoacid:ferredoxin oxidoreductase gamma subunit
MNQILANAIFLSSSNSVQVAEYVGVADTTAEVNSHVAISEAVSTVGRQVVLAPFVPSDLVSALAQADVLLVQSQTTASDNTLIQLGKSWSSALSTFVHSGGIVVLLDGSFPTNSGTVRILVEAGLTNVAAVNVVTGDLCSIKTATDPMAASVSTSGYTCLANSISYKGAGLHVIEDLGQAIVLHFTF